MSKVNATGVFFIQNNDKSKDFENELYSIFSQENMKILATQMKGESCYKFNQILRDKLNELMSSFEVPNDIAENYIHKFITAILSEIEILDKEKSLQVFLGDLRNEEDNNFKIIFNQLDEIKNMLSKMTNNEKSIFSIQEMNYKIKKETISHKIGIDFFVIDDEEFKNNFNDHLKNERIDVSGKSREETVFCLLNEISSKQLDRITYIVTTEEGWKELEKNNIKNSILIPFFYSNEIHIISGNTNIFIWNEDENCNSKDCLKLRRRMKHTIVKCLEKAGFDYQTAQNLVEKTHGLFVPLKKEIYNGRFQRKWDYSKIDTMVLLTALLCGSWTDCEGDKFVIEEMYGQSYDTFYENIVPLTKGENPFIIETENRQIKSFQISNIEEAWENLDSYITQTKWNEFIRIFYSVITDKDKIFEYPIEEHIDLIWKVNRDSIWSAFLKKGMIRTLIMRAYYRQHDENQYQVDEVIKKIFDSVDTREKWAYISQYLPDLCEASPNVVLSEFENELSNPTGMEELFNIKQKNKLFESSYYPNIFWVCGQLLLYKKYVYRTISFLWEFNEILIKDQCLNNLNDLLENVYCAWMNYCVLGASQKMESAKCALKKYENSWKIIYHNLPSEGSYVVPITPPKYRDYDEIPILKISERSETFNVYAYGCLEYVNDSYEKWMKLIDKFNYFPQNKLDDIFEKLIVSTLKMTDKEKTNIKNKLREIIYNSRYFRSSDWSLDESIIEKYEKYYYEIEISNPIYNYVYLFSPSYDFHLMNPVSIDDEEKEICKNKNIDTQEEIKNGITDFVNKGYSTKELLDLVKENSNSTIGLYFAKYLNNGKFDSETFSLLITEKVNKHIIGDYVRFMLQDNLKIIEKAIEVTKKNNADDNLIVYLLSYELFEDINNLLITKQSDEVKKIFWSNYARISNKYSKEIILWAIEECTKYGNISSCFEVLFDSKEVLSKKEIYESLINIDFLSLEVGNVKSFFVKEVLAYVQPYCLDDNERSTKVAQLEIFFRNIIEYNEMKCTLNIIKKEPNLYAEMVNYAFKKDDEKANNKTEKEMKFACSIYDLFYKLRFCPAEEYGKVEYEKLKKWIDDFKILLKKQDQVSLFEYLIGRLFPYSPVGLDGFMPCESVRKIVNEIKSEGVNRAYETCEINKRGVYCNSAGVEELKISKRYQKNADGIRSENPYTATIFDSLAEKYKIEAEYERKRAENE